MKHIARIVVGDEHNSEGILLQGSGPTPEDAKTECLRAIEKHLEMQIEIAPNVVLPPAVATRVPKEIPPGYGLLIMERVSHSDGHPYDWRFFAIPYGKHRVEKNRWHPLGVLVIETLPVLHSFTDSNSEYSFQLPSGSMEHKREGGVFVWVPQTTAEYGY